MTQPQSQNTTKRITDGSDWGNYKPGYPGGPFYAIYLGDPDYPPKPSGGVIRIRQIYRSTKRMFQVFLRGEWLESLSFQLLSMY